MVGRIIPVKKTAEDDEFVTYTWGTPNDQRITRINKRTRAVEPGEGTTMAESEYLGDWVHKVRQLNEMSEFPEEAPILR